ncbi:MAG TPA: hypothetical protein VLZ72_02030, partial [Flavobacterium sp.]|nr:hypothetical protein [Flavobacterium sp.]
MITSDSIFSISGRKDFEKITMKVFRFQYENNAVYREFCDLIKRNPTNVKTINNIPFLPIQFF